MTPGADPSQHKSDPATVLISFHRHYFSHRLQPHAARQERSFQPQRLRRVRSFSFFVTLFLSDRKTFFTAYPSASRSGTDCLWPPTSIPEHTPEEPHRPEPGSTSPPWRRGSESTRRGTRLLTRSFSTRRSTALVRDVVYVLGCCIMRALTESCCRRWKLWQSLQRVSFLVSVPLPCRYP